MTNLSEPSTLSELFARDPLSLTKTDRSEIISIYRERRALYLSGGKAAKPEKTKVEPGVKLKLSDLKLGQLNLSLKK